MHLPRPGGVRTNEEMAAARYPGKPGHPALRVYDEPGYVSEQRWTRKDVGSPLKSGRPSPHAHSPSASFTDGLRQHQIRLRSMASRTRSSTMVERPGRGLGLGQPLRMSNFDKRMSRDDMMLTNRQYGQPFEKPAFDKRMSRDDMSIASKSYGMYGGMHNYDKRMSRDDTALPTRQFDRANYKSYHIPIRGRIPTPDSSPNNDSLRGVTTVRTSTPESMDESGGTGVIAIGMALGSPAHPPWAQPQSLSSVTMHNTVSATSLEINESHDDAQSKTKTRKWGFFGRSKSKRGKGNEANSQPGSADIPQLPSQAQGLVSPPPETPATAQGSNFTQEEPKRRKSLRRRPTISRLQKPPVPEIRPELRPEPRPEPRQDTRPVPASIDIISASRLNLPGGPFLDVEIPSVEMERYSVMFGNVLNPQSSSSLLARRQATLDRVKTTRDDLLPKPKEKKPEVRAEENLLPADEWPRIRRATSPQPARTPSFNIFPATPVRTGEIRALTPSARSRTSPAVLPSPARESPYATAHPAGRVLPKPPVDRQPEQSDVVSKSVLVPKDHPRLVSKFNKQSPKTLSPKTVLVESPKYIERSSEEQAQTRSATISRQSTWQSMSPPPTTSSYTPASTVPRSVPSSSTSPVATALTSPPAELETEEDKAMQNAVEISIARQISVSRQQRTMLRPVKSVRGRKDASPNGVGISTMITVGRKGSTPTVIHPKGEDVTGRAMHRKSSRGIVEDI